MVNPWASRSLVSPAEWETYRATITDLYQNQNKTLKTVMGIMRDEYKFEATTKMYKSRFEQWGLQKNLKSKQVGELLRQKTARDAVGKSTALYIRGKKIPEEKLKAYIQRTSNVNQIWLSAAAPRTSTPSAAQDDMAPRIVCRTPSPAPSSSATSPTSSQFSLPSDASNSTTSCEGAIVSSAITSTDPAAARQVVIIAKDAPQCSRGNSSLVDKAYVAASTANRREALGESHTRIPRIPGRRRPPMLSTSYLKPLEAPRSLLMPEECMHILRDYVDSNFATGVWNKARPPFDSENDRLIEWHDCAVSATSKLRSGNSQAAFKLFNKLFDDYGDLLRAQNFKLFIYTYSIILRVIDEYPGIVKAILRHASGLAQIMYRSRHPLHTIMRILCDMDAQEMCAAARYLMESYLESFEDHLDPSSDYMMVASMARCSMIKNLGTNGVCDRRVARDSLTKSLVKMEQRHGIGSMGVLSARVYIAYSHYETGEYLEARQRVQYITDSTELNQDKFVLSSAYQLLFGVTCKEGTPEEVISVAHKWIAFLSREFGSDHYRTDRASNALKEYLQRIGRLEMEDEGFLEIDPVSDWVKRPGGNPRLKVESEPEECG